LELAHTIAGICRQNLEISFRPERRGEIGHSRGNPTAARRALGLGKPTELRVGLAATLADVGGSSEVL
jgi:hypothetical protein